MSVEKAAQSLERFEVFLERQERREFLADGRAIQSKSLAHDDALDVEPVLSPIGKSLEYDQILCGTGSDDDAGRNAKGARPLDHADFVGKRAEGDVEGNALRRLHQNEVTSTSRVCRGSPHRWTANPPMTQARH